MKPSTGGAGGNAEINEELRIENIKLKSRIITMEKEIQEQHFKASKSNAKDKSNEQYVSIIFKYLHMHFSRSTISVLTVN